MATSYGDKHGQNGSRTWATIILRAKDPLSYLALALLCVAAGLVYLTVQLEGTSRTGALIASIAAFTLLLLIVADLATRKPALTSRPTVDHAKAGSQVESALSSDQSWGLPTQTGVQGNDIYLVVNEDGTWAGGERTFREVASLMKDGWAGGVHFYHRHVDSKRRRLEQLLEQQRLDGLDRCEWDELEELKVYVPAAEARFNRFSLAAQLVLTPSSDIWRMAPLETESALCCLNEVLISLRLALPPENRPRRCALYYPNRGANFKRPPNFVLGTAISFTEEELSSILRCWRNEYDFQRYGRWETLVPGWAMPPELRCTRLLPNIFGHLLRRLEPGTPKSWGEVWPAVSEKLGGPENPRDLFDPESWVLSVKEQPLNDLKWNDHPPQSQSDLSKYVEGSQKSLPKMNDSSGQATGGETDFDEYAEGSGYNSSQRKRPPSWWPP